jgi:hypothetical protein
MPSALFDYVPGSFHTMGQCNPSSVGKRFSFTMPRGSKWTLNPGDDARAREFYCPPEDKTGPIPMPVIPEPVTNVPEIPPRPPAPTPVKPTPIATCRPQEFNPRTGALMNLVTNPVLCGMTGGCVRIGDCTYRELPRLVTPPLGSPLGIVLPSGPSLGTSTIRPSPINPAPGFITPGNRFYDLGPGGGALAR